MATDRSRYGLLVAAIGAVLLVVSVFLPWYGVGFTASGIAEMQRFGQQVISQYGNATLQGYAAPLHANLGSLAGQQFAAVSAHQALEVISVVLLALAGLALVDALFPLVRTTSLPDGAGASLVLLGSVASACVLYRMFHPPTPAGGIVSLSLREGAWLALLGSLAMLAGGMWPRVRQPRGALDTRVDSAWSGLSGWTPQR
jgi:hypothetical protein